MRGQFLDVSYFQRWQSQAGLDWNWEVGKFRHSIFATSALECSWAVGFGQEQPEEEFVPNFEPFFKMRQKEMVIWERWGQKNSTRFYLSINKNKKITKPVIKIFKMTVKATATPYWSYRKLNKSTSLQIQIMVNVNEFVAIRKKKLHVC